MQHSIPRRGFTQVHDGLFRGNRDHHVTMNLTALAREIHGDNIRAGWWKEIDGVTQQRNIGELICLMHSEISEAAEGYRCSLKDDKLPHRDMFEVEMADTAIRILDTLGFYAVDIEHRIFTDTPPTWFWPGVPVGEMLLAMHGELSGAMEGFRKGNELRATGRLINALRLVIDCCERTGADLFGAIAEKRRFNATRADHRPENRAADGGKKF